MKNRLAGKMESRFNYDINLNECESKILKEEV
jgi:hypothetical protein